jgi:Phage integrase, N-terminal SAM-like domain
MSPLRERMIEDMILAGLALGTRQAYTQAVGRLAARYRRSPDQLSEEEVRAYLLELRQRDAVRGSSRLACTTADSSTSTHSTRLGSVPGE